MNDNKRSAWFWVPSLYYAEAIPNILIVTVSVVFYKRMGISNTDITLYTSLLYWPWVIKPLWSPIVDIFKTKRYWIISSQLIISLGLVFFALTIPFNNFFTITLFIFWLLAFCSATHDIAADGFYMLALSKHQQTWFVGIRSTFYRIAMVSGGMLIMLAGYLEIRLKNIPSAWLVTFIAIAVLYFLFFLYHKFILPHPSSDKSNQMDPSSSFLNDFKQTFIQFFKKERIRIIISFLLLYRLAEAQLVKIAPLFLLDTKEAGGLGMTTTEFGMVYSTIGAIMLVAGGITGGLVAARQGLKYWIWWMALALNLPDFVYLYFACYPPDSFLLINLGIALEQFGYGFGFTAYVLYMIYISEGRFKTAHYAIATGFMAMGLMIPGLFSGWFQQLLGYKYFFTWVIIATIPGLLLLKYIPLDPEFGKKK
jgi:PAT family beta-lactamase induction signal transducer AmpG